MIKTRRVKAWIILNEKSEAIIAKEAGVSRQMVNFYVNGKRLSPRLTAWFLENGCPARFLGGEAAKYGKEAA